MDSATEDYKMTRRDKLVWFLRERGWILSAKAFAFLCNIPTMISRVEPRTPARVIAYLAKKWREDDWDAEQWHEFFASLPARHARLARWRSERVRQDGRQATAEDEDTPRPERSPE